MHKTCSGTNHNVNDSYLISIDSRIVTEQAKRMAEQRIALAQAELALLSAQQFILNLGLDTEVIQSSDTYKQISDWLDGNYYWRSNQKMLKDAQWHCFQVIS